MGDILRTEIHSKVKVVDCKECGSRPTVMQRKRNANFSIGCPKCGSQSRLYSWSGKADWEGYDPAAMAVADWNHKNKT